MKRIMNIKAVLERKIVLYICEYLPRQKLPTMDETVNCVCERFLVQWQERSRKTSRKGERRDKSGEQRT